MSRLFSRVIGGALKGVGSGLVMEAEERRKAMMLDLERQYRRQDADYEAGLRTAENVRGEAIRGGLMTGAPVKGKDGKLYGVTAGGDTKDLGIEFEPDATAASPLEKVWDPDRKAYVYKPRGEAAGSLAEDPDKPASGSSEALVQVFNEASGQMEWIDRGQAAGKPSTDPTGGTRNRTIADVMAPIFEDIANNKTLSPGQERALREYAKSDSILSLLGMGRGGLAGGGLTDDQTPGAAPTAARPAPAAPKKMLPRGGGVMPSALADKPAGKDQPPKEYPDAKWSDKAQAWVVSRNGKWFAVD